MPKSHLDEKIVKNTGLKYDGLGKIGQHLSCLTPIGKTDTK